jgi:hypothetical protein
MKQTTSNPEAIKYALNLVATAEGKVANRDSDGLDVFTAMSADRKIYMINGAAENGNDGLLTNGVHAISVKKFDDNNNEYRIDCENFEPVYKHEMNNRSWWSVAMATYESPAAAQRAAEKILKEAEKVGRDVPVCLMSDVVEAAKETKNKKATESLAALFNIRTQRRGLPSKVSTLPTRFDPEKTVMIYDPSSSPNDLNGLWTNTRRTQVEETTENELESQEHEPFS